MSSEKRTTFMNDWKHEIIGIPDNTTTIELVKKDIKHMRNAIIDAARRSYWNSVVHYGTLVQQKEEELMLLERQQDDYNILIGAKL
ncbi:hypothetical protein BCPG1_117 [Bacillus phage BCPG1]|uniref:Uncharacterized protein n=2 Tax=Wphvirus TaxID=1922327 RepID=W5QUC0_9CAUD|nr:hypothetical protein [Bacillus thuringiensis]YP_009003045.1 hypothetical protein BPS10C_159 [Bacillus phage BPS10C]YP_009282146.1 hypothetical protein SALINJAH_192 [Bacillus phage SalinJah]QQO38848.1 hypothetical protein BCPG1_117 [Bacillus phage BCPG1]QSJ04671.1 hypothetical protein BCP18_139 [Bacillus phage BCP18]AGI12156.1 hypothetical protein BPS10C_159 [Bacillus phage BPS10C]ANH50749.1 hypothetical protein SALINJAH_192 [Bacillus phage SalinJah]OTZ47861.1 hypothetical protein BK762_19